LAILGFEVLEKLGLDGFGLGVLEKLGLERFGPETLEKLGLRGAITLITFLGLSESPSSVRVDLI